MQYILVTINGYTQIINTNKNVFKCFSESKPMFFLALWIVTAGSLSYSKKSHEMTIDDCCEKSLDRKLKYSSIHQISWYYVSVSCFCSQSLPVLREDHTHTNSMLRQTWQEHKTAYIQQNGVESAHLWINTQKCTNTCKHT